MAGKKTGQYSWSSGKGSALERKEKRKRKKMKTKDVVSVATQMANMLNSGLPLLDIFDCFAADKYSSITSDAVVWKGEVARGKPLHEALDAGVWEFPSTMLTIVKAGEETGHLSESLLIYIRELKRIDMTERKLRSAITYPSVVIAISLLLMVILFTVAIPKLEGMFTAAKSAPKGVSAIIFAIGRQLSAIGTKPLVILALVFDVWLFSPNGRNAVIRFFSFIPAVRQITDLSSWGIFSASLGIALNAGLSVVQSLEISRDNAPKELRGPKYDMLLNGVVQGKGLLEIDGIAFPPYIQGYIRVAERTGGLAEAFASISEYYSHEVEEKIGSFSQTVEPVLIVMVIGVVSVVPVAIIKAISDMYISMMGTIGK